MVVWHGQAELPFVFIKQIFFVNGSMYNIDHIKKNPEMVDYVVTVF